MSANNLNEQLSWLLETKPFLPPPYTPRPAEGLDTSDAQDQHTNAEPVRPLHQAEAVAASVVELEAAAAETPNCEQSDMVRLRAPASPTRKPRLLAQDPCQTSGLDAQRRSGASKNAFSDRIPPIQDFHADPLLPKPVSRIQPSERRGFAETTPKPRIETLDLTGDYDSASTTNQARTDTATDQSSQKLVQRTNRKRKSDEYERDFHASSCRRQKPALAKPPQGSFTSEFHNIDDLVNDEGRQSPDPPPPYSTIAPDLSQLSSVAQIHKVTQDLQSYPNTICADEDDADFARYFSQASSIASSIRSQGEHEAASAAPQLRPTVTIQVGREPGQDTADNNHTLGNDTAIGSTTMLGLQANETGVNVSLDSSGAAADVSPKGNQTPVLPSDLAPTTAIADSEDESEPIDWDESKPYGSDSNPEYAKISPKKTLAKSLATTPGQEDLQIGLQGRESEPPHQHEVLNKCELKGLEQPTTKSSPSPEEILRSAKTPVNVQHEAAKSPLTQNDDNDDDSLTVSKDSDELVKEFSRWTSNDLLRRSDAYSELWAQANEDYVDAVAEEASDVSALREARQRCKVRRDALNRLLQSRREYSDLAQKKDALRKEYLQLLGDDCEPDSDFTAKLQEVTRAWRNSESNLISLIKTAELGSPPEHLSGRQRQQVAVQSTQLQAERSLPTLPIPGSTGTQTQTIRQTQAPQTLVFDPPLPSNIGAAAAKNRLPSKPSEAQVQPLRGKTRAHDYAASSPEFDAYGESDDLFSRHMGMPADAAFNEDEGDFDFDEDDEMLADLHDFHEPLLSRPFPTGRPVFAERSHNVSYSRDSLADLAAPADGGRSKPGKSSNTPAIPELQYPWSSDVVAAMTQKFHLRGFRPNQLDAINATLSGKDVFVLMPTGGGKSLCYQLPSIIRSGATRGVTVVVSPLLSLMEDQVSHLQKLNIQALVLNSESGQERRTLVFNALRDPNVEQLIQLLYVTPEMLSKSQAVVNALHRLHSNGKLARIVIDEAHCVSQWGHDFRPDYKSLGEVRQGFRGVSVMALTATATENVKVDVIHNLGMEGCKVFTQSFNRPNLVYEVIAKGKGSEPVKNMADTIMSKYPRKCGIIYCLSRKKCELIAEELRKKHNIDARHYHAHVDPDEKKKIQKDWQAGRFHVIVATIAFGMGIDKPDVRFVMHHSLPKSLEGYYQETGRAGRDGKRSGCYLYYGYQDCTALKRMIEDGEGSREQKERQFNMLRNVVAYCENKADCRRAQVLAYFNETFDKENCHGTCDNCNSTSTFEIQDFTEHAENAIKVVQQISRQNPTVLQCVDILRGAKTKKITLANWNQLHQYGSASDIDRNDVERLFYRLLSEKALGEENVVNRAGFATQYLKLGPMYREFRRGRRSIKIQTVVSSAAKAKKAKPAAAKRGDKEPTGARARQPLPVSTNVSSPVQDVANRRQAKRKAKPRDHMKSDRSEIWEGGFHGYDADDGFCVPDDQEQDESEESDAFEPVRVAGRPPRRREEALTAPITGDSDLDGLHEIHKKVVEDFVVEARRECKDIQQSKGLRMLPFTDTMLRHMGITFPKSREAILEIPGTRAEMVDAYGARFLKLIAKHEKKYTELMQQNDDRPNDPNRYNVIDLVDDDDDDNYDDGNARFGDAADDPDLSQEEQSEYFQNSHVAQFNAQWDRAQTAAPPRQPSRGRGGGGTWNGKKRFRGGGKGRGGHGAGVTKKSSTKRTSGATAGQRSRGGQSYGAGGAGTTGQRTAARGGIGMMPT